MCFFADSVGLLKEDDLMPRSSVFVGRGRDLTGQPTLKHQNPAAKATNSDSFYHTVAQIKEHITQQRTASTE